MVKGLDEEMYEEWLRSLGLFSPEQNRPRGGLMAACSSLMRGAERAGTELCSRDSNRTQGNSMELGQGRVRLGVRERFCTERVVGQAPQGRGHDTEPARIQEAFGQHFQT